MNFHLTATSTNPKDGQAVMTYTGDDGKTVKFQMHPKLPFYWLFYPTSTASKQVQGKLVEAYVESPDYPLLTV